MLIEVLALGRWFRLRRNAVLRFYVDFDCAGSHKVAVPIFTISKASFYRVFVHVFAHERHFAWQVQGIRHLWRSETSVYVAGARNRTHCENRGRRSVSWTLPKRWQACVIRRIAFYVAGAGNPHHGSYILRSRGSIPERGCICRIWAWGCFCVASAAFRMTSGHDFVAGAVLLKHGFEMWTLCGDRACRVCGMQVKLRFLISKCNHLRRSCVSSVRNAGEIAFLNFEVQPSAEMVRVKRAECRWNCDFRFRSATLCGDGVCPSCEMLVKLLFLISYKDLAQEVLQNPDADILTERSCARDPHTEILHKRSYRILMHTSWQRDLGQEIRRHRSCTRGPTGSRCRHHDREILHKKSADRALAQEVLQDPDADIMTERSWTRDPHTEILHKWSDRILMQRSWQRHLAQEIRRQRSCTRGSTGSRCRHHDREILHKKSADRALAQEVLQDPDADIMTERSWTRDPHTEILHKWSYRILMQRSWQRHLAQEIRRQKSCTSGLAQVVIQDPDAEIVAERSCTRDPHTEILYKRSYRIMMQTSCQRDLGQEILIQRSCTRGPIGTWCRHHDREILDKRSSYRDLAQVVLRDPAADILSEKSCTRDPHTETLHKRSCKILWFYRDLGERGPEEPWWRDPQMGVSRFRLDRYSLFLCVFQYFTRLYHDFTRLYHDLTWICFFWDVGTLFIFFAASWAKPPNCELLRPSPGPTPVVVARGPGAEHSSQDAMPAPWIHLLNGSWPWMPLLLWHHRPCWHWHHHRRRIPSHDWTWHMALMVKNATVLRARAWPRNLGASLPSDAWRKSRRHWPRLLEHTPWGCGALACLAEAVHSILLDPSLPSRIVSAVFCCNPSGSVGKRSNPGARCLTMTSCKRGQLGSAAGRRQPWRHSRLASRPTSDAATSLWFFIGS